MRCAPKKNMSKFRIFANHEIRVQQDLYESNGHIVCDTRRVHIQHHLLINQLTDLRMCSIVAGIGEDYLP